MGTTQTSKNKFEKQPQYEYLIGVDPGINTGIAVWDCGKNKFVKIDSQTITYCFESLLFCISEGIKIAVIIEDARQRTWFGNKGREALQGAGSIKRDCKIWEDFLTENNIPFKMEKPKKNMTKINAEAFKKLTGYAERTNQHGRDAAMLVFGRNHL
ncbi:MAG: hypothetical protein FWC34_00255 [Bacteroidetes bacterium]|nr:hypothetical protein [Bacteroidota bacterium]